MSSKEIALFKQFFLTGISTLLMANSALAAHYHDDVEAYPPWKKGEGLGNIQLELKSTNLEANRHLINGMKLMYCYEFPESVWSFRKSQELDPKQALAYIGEVLANYMLIWKTSDIQQGEAALKRLKDNIPDSDLTSKEKMYINAVRELLNPEASRLQAYERGSNVWNFSQKMQKMAKTYPNDIEVKLLNAYGILGTRRDVLDYQINQQAIVILKEVLAVNPNHPGAMHFLLHASENTEQFIFARKTAQRMPKVLFGTIHMLHMPTHIYYPEGNWKKVISLNQYAWEQSKQRVTDLKLSEDNLEYHGFMWLIYALLQQGDSERAYEKLQEYLKLFNKKPGHTRANYLLYSRANFLGSLPINNRYMKSVLAIKLPNHTVKTSAGYANAFGDLYTYWRMNNQSDFFASVKRFKALNFVKMGKIDITYLDAIKVMKMQVKGLSALVKGNKEQGVKYLKMATRIEDKAHLDHGVPLLAVPAHELLAEVYLQMNQPGLAKLHYRLSLHTQTNRLPSVVGLKKAQNQIQQYIKASSGFRLF